MLTQGVDFFLLLSIALIAASAFQRTNRRLNFLWITNGVFLAVMLPKIVLVSIDRNFLITPFHISDPAIDAGVLTISIYIIVINLIYLVLRSPPKTIAPLPAIRLQTTVPIVFLILPVFVAGVGVFLATADITPETVFSKPDMVEDGSVTTAYIAHKFAQVINCAFYIFLLRLLTAERLSVAERLAFVGIFLLCVAVYALAGLRSGIFLLMIQLILVLQVRNRMRLRLIFYLGVLFMVMNFFILNARIGEYQTVDIARYVLLLLRRYFFDVEKISAILEYTSATHSYMYGPWNVFLDHADPIAVDGNIHQFIAQHIFGTGGGVPPSYLGEVIFYCGGVYVIPATILMTVLLRFAEIRLEKNRSPVVQLCYIVILSTAYFFLSNSDVYGMFVRMAFELCLFALAVVVSAPQPIRTPDPPASQHPPVEPHGRPAGPHMAR